MLREALVCSVIGMTSVSSSMLYEILPYVVMYHVVVCDRVFDGCGNIVRESVIQQVRLQ